MTTTTTEPEYQTLYIDTEKSGADYITDYANLPGVQGELWHGHKIPVLGVCGEIGQGKTTFLLDIACGPVCYVDLPAEMVKTHANGWKPVDVYLKWLAIMRAVPVGKFRVIALDVSEEIESGIADWVWQNPLYFNHTTGQYMKMNAIYQSDVSSLCKMIFAEIASKCETFAFANHMGLVFKGGEPTGEKKNKGRPVFKQLAALYLRLQRDRDTAGKVSAKPSGSVDLAEGGKARLRTRVNGEWVPILPPRLPVATPDAIRGYIVKPPDYAALKPEECTPDKPLTDDQRTQLRIQAAQAESETERLRIERMQAERQATGQQQTQQQHSQPLPSGDSGAVGEPVPSSTPGVTATGQANVSDGHPPAPPVQPAPLPETAPAQSPAADEDPSERQKLRDAITAAVTALGLPADKVTEHIRTLIREVNEGIDASLGRLGPKKLAAILEKLRPAAPTTENQTLRDAMAAQPPQPAKAPTDALPLTPKQLFHELLVIAPLPPGVPQDAAWQGLLTKVGVNGTAPTAEQDATMRTIITEKIRAAYVAKGMSSPF